MLNTTTAIRFHFIEFLLSFIIKLPFLFILGIDVFYLAFYEIILNIVSYFIHSNIYISSKLDFTLSKVIVTPNMHRLHHSIIYNENNTNFSSILSIWDKIFGSFLYKDNINEIKFGLKEFQDKKWNTIFYILYVPFKKEL